MNNVKSKYKNPDKLICRLKRKIEALEQARSSRLLSEGYQVAHYAPEHSKELSSSSSSRFGAFRVGESVIIHAVISEVSESRESSSITYDNIYVNRVRGTA